MVMKTPPPEQDSKPATAPSAFTAGRGRGICNFCRLCLGLAAACFRGRKWDARERQRGEEVWASAATVHAKMAAPSERAARRTSKRSVRAPRPCYMDRGAEFRRWKAQCLSKADLSRKGSVDEEVVDLVRLLNAREEFFTTSSCAGRIVVLDGVRLLRPPSGLFAWESQG